MKLNDFEDGDIIKTSGSSGNTTEYVFVVRKNNYLTHLNGNHVHLSQSDAERDDWQLYGKSLLEASIEKPEASQYLIPPLETEYTNEYLAANIKLLIERVKELEDIVKGDK